MSIIKAIIYFSIFLLISQNGFCSSKPVVGALEASALDEEGHVPRARKSTKPVVVYESFKTSDNILFQCYRVDASQIPGLESIPFETPHAFTVSELTDPDFPKPLHKADLFWEHLHPAKVKQKLKGNFHGFTSENPSSPDSEESSQNSSKLESLMSPRIDRRIRVDLDEDENLHHLCNGKLEMRFRHKADSTKFLIGVGTAFMISEYCAATCGHNVFLPKEIQDENPDFEPLADSVRFMPGLHGTDIKFDVKAKSFHISPAWVATNGEDYTNDFALLCFDDLFDDGEGSYLPVGQHVGFVRLATLEDTELTDKDIHVTGYPGEKNGFMYTHSGKVIKFNESFIWHNVDTTSGNSGSKIGWHDYSKSETIVIGIHTQGLDDTGFNSGVRLTKEKLDVIRHWKKAATTTAVSK